LVSTVIVYAVSGFVNYMMCTILSSVCFPTRTKHEYGMLPVPIQLRRLRPDRSLQATGTAG